MTTNRIPTTNGLWIKVERVGRNFGWVGAVQYRNGRTIATTEVCAGRDLAEALAMDLAALLPERRLR